MFPSEAHHVCLIIFYDASHHRWSWARLTTSLKLEIWLYSFFTHLFVRRYIRIEISLENYLVILRYSLYGKCLTPPPLYVNLYLSFKRINSLEFSKGEQWAYILVLLQAHGFQCMRSVWIQRCTVSLVVVVF